MASAILAAVANAQTGRTVAGIVSDSLGLPIRYARIQAGNVAALTSDSGRFILALESRNPAMLEVRRLGYGPVTLAILAGGDTSVAIVMNTVPQRLTSVRVIAEQVRKLELSGFYARLADRRKWGGSAQFVTPEDIELRHPNRVTQLLEGLNAVRPLRANECHIFVRCWVAVGHGNCVMAVYVDGVRLQPELVNPNIPNRMKETVYIDDVVHVSDISAMEVYSRPTQAPPQYQSDVGKCGVILIWTK